MNVNINDLQKYHYCESTYYDDLFHSPLIRRQSIISTSKVAVKKAFFVIILAFYGLCSSGQSYLGTISKQANFREGPGKEYDLISSLKTGRQIFILSLETEYDFYSIIDIKTNKTGYVHKSYVTIGKSIPKSEGDLFTPSGSTEEANPEIEVFNNTSLSLTLRLNTDLYTFSPKEKKTITLSAISYNFIASAPGVIPNYGSEILQSNTKYTWQFYIITRRR